MCVIISFQIIKLLFEVIREPNHIDNLIKRILSDYDFDYLIRSDFIEIILS
jgi:hypothetical protein